MKTLLGALAAAALFAAPALAQSDTRADDQRCPGTLTQPREQPGTGGSGYPGLEEDRNLNRNLGQDGQPSDSGSTFDTGETSDRTRSTVPETTPGPANPVPDVQSVQP